MEKKQKCGNKYTRQKKTGCFYRIQTNWDQFNHSSRSPEARQRVGFSPEQEISTDNRVLVGLVFTSHHLSEILADFLDASFSSRVFFFQTRIIRCGCSRLARNLSRNREASWSSTRRPSLDSVTVISCWVRRVWSSSCSRSSGLEVPTARMHD